MFIPELNLTRKLNKNAIIFDDIFEDGLNGWVQLATPSATQTDLGSVYLADRGSFSGNCVSIRTDDTPSTSRGGVSMGIKRSNQYFGPGKYLAEFWTSLWQITADTTRPRWYSWGVDTALHDGTRRFFELRWLNYDEALAQRVYKLQINTATGWVDVPGGQWDIPMNENKDMVFYIALEIDTNTGLYNGIQVGHFLKVGSLAPTPDGTIKALGQPASSSLVPFADGLNLTSSVVNRSSGAVTAGRVDIHRARASFIGS